MTVCAAVLCENEKIIVCIADRMFNSRNIENEPLTKIIDLTHHLCDMLGEGLLNTEISYLVRNVVRDFMVIP